VSSSLDGSGACAPAVAASPIAKVPNNHRFAMFSI
jgi:hypothetical protein